MDGDLPTKNVSEILPRSPEHPFSQVLVVVGQWHDGVLPLGTRLRRRLYAGPGDSVHRSGPVFGLARSCWRPAFIYTGWPELVARPSGAENWPGICVYVFSGPAGFKKGFQEGKKQTLAFLSIQVPPAPPVPSRTSLAPCWACEVRRGGGGRSSTQIVWELEGAWRHRIWLRWCPMAHNFPGRRFSGARLGPRPSPISTPSMKLLKRMLQIRNVAHNEPEPPSESEMPRQPQFARPRWKAGPY